VVSGEWTGMKPRQWSVQKWVGPVAATGRHVLVFGEAVRPLAAPAMVWALRRGGRVVVLDAALAFDPYRLAREARRRGLAPAAALAAVRVARAFTCHQLVRLVQEDLPRELSGSGATLLLVLGPCTLFYDEQVPLAERRRLFAALVAGLARLKTRAALWLIQPNLPPVVGNQHFGRQLAGLVEQVWEVGDDVRRPRGGRGSAAPPAPGRRSGTGPVVWRRRRSGAGCPPGRRC